MKFEEILPKFRDGAKIRLSTWVDKDICLYNDTGIVCASWDGKPWDLSNHVVDGDWEIYDDTVDASEILPGKKFTYKGHVYIKRNTNDYYIQQLLKGRTDTSVGIRIDNGTLHYFGPHDRVKKSD